VVFLWRKVIDAKKISTIDLTNILRKGLENDLPYQIDRRTVFRLLQDLKDLWFVNIHSYKVIVESDKIVSNINEISRTIVANAFVDLSASELRDDPSINNPFFRRNEELPESLKFLSGEQKQMNTNQTIMEFKGEYNKDQVEKRLKTETGFEQSGDEKNYSSITDTNNTSNGLYKNGKDPEVKVQL
jgi:hypothetical protein